MPTYDYRCDANGRVVEVKHGMNEQLATWGELCEKVGMEAGDTPVDAPVRKIITGGQVVNSTNLRDVPPCQSGPCCGGGSCGFQ